MLRSKKAQFRPLVSGATTCDLLPRLFLDKFTGRSQNPTVPRKDRDWTSPKWDMEIWHLAIKLGMNWDLTRIEQIALEHQNIIYREALMKLQLQANYGNFTAQRSSINTWLAHRVWITAMSHCYGYYPLMYFTWLFTHHLLTGMCPQVVKVVFPFCWNHQFQL
jgi:hypothetical protein